MTTTQAENNTQHRESQQKRVQLDHVLLDVDFFDKPKIRSLKVRFTALGTLLLVRILADISRATNAEIDKDCLQFLADDVGFTRTDEFLSYCVEKEILLVTQNGNISNKRVAEDQSKLAEQQEKWRKAKRFSKDSHENLKGIQEESHEILNVQKCEVLNTEDLNTEESRKGVQGETKIFEVKEVQKQPADWLKTRKIPETLRDAVRRWRENLRKNGRDYDEIQFEAHACNYGQRLKEFETDLNFSAAANWKTLHSKPPDPLPESEKIAIAAREKAQVLKPVEKPRPHPPPFVPEKIETPSPEAVRKFKEGLAKIGRKMPSVTKEVSETIIIDR